MSKIHQQNTPLPHFLYKYHRDHSFWHEFSLVICVSPSELFRFVEVTRLTPVNIIPTLVKLPGMIPALSYTRSKPALPSLKLKIAEDTPISIVIFPQIHLLGISTKSIDSMPRCNFVFDREDIFLAVNHCQGQNAKI